MGMSKVEEVKELCKDLEKLNCEKKSTENDLRAEKARAASIDDTGLRYFSVRCNGYVALDEYTFKRLNDKDKAFHYLNKLKDLVMEAQNEYLRTWEEKLKNIDQEIAEKENKLKILLGDNL